VLFLNTPTLPPLGADTAVHARIIAGLDRRAHELFVGCFFGRKGRRTPTYDIMRTIPDITLVDVNLGPELATRTRWEKVRGALETLPAVFSLAKLSVLIRRRGIDVIHTSDRPRDAFAAVVLARLTRARCIIHCHVAYDPSWMSRLLTWSIPRADALIAISNFVAGTLPAPRRPSQQVHVVLNAADTDRFQPGVGRDLVRRELGVDETTIVVVTVCRLIPGKGVAHLIRALPLVRKVTNDVRLVVVGEAVRQEYSDELNHLIDSMDVRAHVDLLGWRADVPPLMAGADIFALPSFGEPFGLVYLEAMATALPVVALNNGGTPEVVVDRGTGLLSDPDDIESLAANIVTLANDPQLRASMGQQGRERALHEFTAQRLCREIADVYQMLVFGSLLTPEGENRGS
jgi:glycosyltransferase involved in cell wall biosynthesis